jgi:hypothetical protein
LHQGDVVLRRPSFVAIVVVNVDHKQDEIGDLMVKVTNSRFFFNYTTLVEHEKCQAL